MGIAASVLLVAIGAILIWGLDASIGGVHVNTIGWICLIIGVIGALVSVMFWASSGAKDRASVRRRHVDKV